MTVALTLLIEASRAYHANPLDSMARDRLVRMTRILITGINSTISRTVFQDMGSGLAFITSKGGQTSQHKTRFQPHGGRSPQPPAANSGDIA